MRDPHVSVVIPFYSGTAQLRRALNSVRLQTYADYEVIVVSDDSPDDLTWVPREFPGTTLVVLPSNRGPGVARNTGIDAATGTFVAFLDSDDWWYPHKLATQIPLMESADAFWGHHPYDIVAEDGTAIRRIENYGLFGEVGQQTLRSFRVQTSCMVFRRALFAELGYAFGEMRIGEDGHLYQQVARRYQLHRTPHALSAFLSHGANAGFSPAVQLWSRWRTAQTLDAAQFEDLAPLDRFAYRWAHVAATTLGLDWDSPPRTDRHTFTASVAYAPAWLAFQWPRREGS